MKILAPPQNIEISLNKSEILRVCIDGGKLSLVFANDINELYDNEVELIWGLLLSDIAHHVIDAIEIETKLPKFQIKDKLLNSLINTNESNRKTYSNKVFTQNRSPQLDLKVINDNDDTVEIVRIILFEKEINVIAFVGMWLESNSEEKVWGDLLYDIASIIAFNLPGLFNKTKRKNQIIDYLVKYIDSPSTDSYTGKFF